MKSLESGKDKVKKICDLLRHETLEPAQEEAGKILEMARFRAEEIVAEARHKAEQMQLEARRDIEQQKRALHTSLTQASRQILDSLKEKITHELFSPELSHLLKKPLQESKVVAKLIQVVLQALEKEGLEADLTVAISSSVSAREVNELLTSQVLQKLKEKGVLLSSIAGGAEVKLLGQNMIIDLSDAAFKALIESYTRKDLLEFVFGALSG